VAMPQRPVISVPQQNGSCSFMPAYLPASGALETWPKTRVLRPDAV
jgi:hypothetical protein